MVVFHDPILGRMTDGRGFVKNKSLSDLKKLRLKSPGKRLREPIPTLEETIELTKDRVILNIEIKTNGLPKNGLEQKVVDMIRIYGLEDKAIISSFNPLVIRRIRKINHRVLTGYLVDKNFTIRNSEIPLTKFSGAQAIHLEKSLVSDKLIKKIHNAGFRSVVWTVNEPEMMARFIKLGVNMIITDAPDRLQNQSESKPE